MNDTCERVRDLVPELALGVADGEERAGALEHLDHCADCRRYLEELSATADELVLLAPPTEPPLGFEARALEAIQPARARRWPRRARWRIAAAALAAAALAATAVWLATSSDRDVADRYRQTLAVANGKYLAAAPLETSVGRRVGTVFGYQGEPSWCLIVVDQDADGAIRAGSYEVELATEGGRRIPWRAIAVTAGEGSAGGTIPLDYHELAEIRLLAQGRGEVAGAELGSRD